MAPGTAPATRTRPLGGFGLALSQDGSTLYRVRLGPYGRVEDLDKIRQVLATNGIDVQVVTIK